VDAGSADQDAILFKPTTAWRVRWNTSTDMPWPKEEPTAPNPPEGAGINYYLKSAAAGPVVLEILEPDGRLVRRYSSADPVPQIPDPADAPVPVYWYRQPQVLSTAAGMHRFMWDVHYQPLESPGAGEGRGGTATIRLPIQAIPHNTGPSPSTPWVNPGTYTVKLTVNGRSFTQPVVVAQDPRVKTPASAMQQVYSLTHALYYGAVDARQAAASLGDIRKQIADLKPQAKGPVAAALTAFDEKAEALEGTAPQMGGGRGRGGGGGGRGRGGGQAGAAESLWAVSASLGGLMNSMQAADVPPTANTMNAVTAARQSAERVMKQWSTLKNADLAALNAQLKAAGLPQIRID
jgi:hypothetical protein